MAAVRSAGAKPTPKAQSGMAGTSGLGTWNTPQWTLGRWINRASKTKTRMGIAAARSAKIQKAETRAAAV